jgi:hypothetical protein
MGEARSQLAWNHTSAVLAMLANLHRDQRKKPSPYKPADFHPHIRMKPATIQKVGIAVLKQIFIDR